MSDLEILFLVFLWHLCYIVMLVIIKPEKESVMFGLMFLWPLFFLKTVIRVIIAIIGVVFSLIVYLITNSYKIVIDTFKELFSLK